MNTEDLQELRQEYSGYDLDENDVKPNPINQFDQWMEEALNAAVPEANAMTLATTDKEGKPHARIVLLKGADKDGFVFYTNYASDKGVELEDNPNAALCFLWSELGRQVRIEGTVEKLDEEEVNEYFQKRPYRSQIGAHASDQSAVVESRELLEEKFNKLIQRYSEGQVPKPNSWGGYRVLPTAIEFWQGRSSRLHDRIKYYKENNDWVIKRLCP
ncbi:MAG: pyridoxamine 5'-phosphate oxidase [Balneolaceae bacterium]|nr:pyridoxamine 5'-phosphate oxidase [Balneolaceae bacterium]